MRRPQLCDIIKYFDEPKFCVYSFHGNVFRGPVKTRDKLSLKIRDKGEISKRKFNPPERR